MTTERQPSREPGTEAGRLLLSYIGVTPNGLRVIAATHVERLVPAIEAEAVAAARAKVVVEMENEGVVTWGDARHRGRFLALAAPREETPNG